MTDEIDMEARSADEIKVEIAGHTFLLPLDEAKRMRERLDAQLDNHP